MNILLGHFNAKVGREDIFKPTIGNESLHAISSDNGIRIVNFTTSKNLIAKSTMFPHHNIHCDTDHYLALAKTGERLAVSKQTLQRIHMERFNLRKLNEVEGKEQYRIDISNKFAALENLRH
jgi:hypothetical protein